MTLRDKVLAATIRTIDSEWDDLCATLAKHHASRIGVNAVKSLVDEVPAFKTSAQLTFALIHALPSDLSTQEDTHNALVECKEILVSHGCDDSFTGAEKDELLFGRSLFENFKSRAKETFLWSSRPATMASRDLGKLMTVVSDSVYEYLGGLGFFNLTLADVERLITINQAGQTDIALHMIKKHRVRLVNHFFPFDETDVPVDVDLFMREDV